MSTLVLCEKGIFGNVKHWVWRRGMYVRVNGYKMNIECWFLEYQARGAPHWLVNVLIPLWVMLVNGQKEYY